MGQASHNGIGGVTVGGAEWSGRSQEQKLQRKEIVRGTILAEIFERQDMLGTCRRLDS